MLDTNMDKEDFLRELHKEGILSYGDTYFEDFKHLQELKKYKDMWEKLEEEYHDSVGGLMYLIEQKYFPETKELKELERLLIELDNVIKKVLNGF